MPKRILTINDFSGGLNTLQDPADISVNEMQIANNLMFTRQGIVEPVYLMNNATNNKIADLSNTNIITVEPGYGLGYFETDHQSVVGSTLTVVGNESAPNYAGLSFVTSGDNHYLFHTSYDSGFTDEEITELFPVGSEIKITGFGAGNGASNLALKPREGIYRVVGHVSKSLPAPFTMTLTALQLDRALLSGNDLWFSGVITGHPYGDKLVLLANPPKHKIDVWSEKNSTTWASDVITLCSYEQGTDSKVKYYRVEDSIRCCDIQENSQSKIQWYGWISRTHFANTQESNSILGFYVKDNNLASPTAQSIAYGDNVPAVVSSWVSAGQGWALYVASDTTVDGYIDDTVEYEFAQTFIYDGNQESLPVEYGPSDTVDADTALKSLSVNVGAQGDYDERISGGRIYIRELDGDFEWSLLVDIDLTSGCRVNLSDRYTAWHHSADNKFLCPTATASANFIVKEISDVTYNVINGFSSSTFSIDIYKSGERWQDVTIANERAFVCGVTIADENKGEYKDEASTTEFRDRIMYSMAGRYDTFPYHKYIETAKGDKDNYVAIDAFADRLLAFKRFSLDIINIAGEMDATDWFLESSSKYQGVRHSEAVKRTQYGVVWANTQGLFIYDGTSIKNLSENKILDSDWAGHITDGSGIIYDEQESMVFVISDMGSDGDAYMCDLKKGTFTFIINFILDTYDGITNSVDSEDNNTYIGTDIGSGVDIYKLYRSPQTVDASTTSYQMRTKNFDFGDPSTEKKIYAVYLTYKTDAGSASAANAKLYYEGDGVPANVSLGTLAQSENKWTTKKLTPSAPVRCTKAAVEVSSGGDDLQLYINDIGIEYRTLDKRAG